MSEADVDADSDGNALMDQIPAVIFPDINITANGPLFCCFPLFPLQIQNNSAFPGVQGSLQQVPLFSPWRPGDAYSAGQEDWPSASFLPVLATWQQQPNGGQIR